MPCHAQHYVTPNAAPCLTLRHSACAICLPSPSRLGIIPSHVTTRRVSTIQYDILRERQHSLNFFIIIYCHNCITEPNKPISVCLTCSKAKHWCQDVVKESGYWLQGTKQGELEANAQGSEFPVGLQALFKGKIMGKGCRVCDQLIPILLIVSGEVPEDCFRSFNCQCSDSSQSGVSVLVFRRWPVLWGFKFL